MENRGSGMSQSASAEAEPGRVRTIRSVFWWEWEQKDGQMELSQEGTSVYWLLRDSRGSNFSSTSLTLTPEETAL